MKTKPSGRRDTLTCLIRSMLNGMPSTPLQDEMPRMERGMAEIRSSSHRATNAKVFELITGQDIRRKRVLDIGAGKGHMVQHLGDHVRSLGGVPAEVLSACDLFPEFFLYEEVPCERMEFVHELPYASESFDIVYAIEVIEHLKNPYDFIHEMHRTVKPGGMAIITTPNILNLSSRLAYLFTGFFGLFGPLSLDPGDARRQWGHIMPLSAYYLAHGMRAAGFSSTEFHADRMKRSALFLSLLFLPLVKLSTWIYTVRIRRKKPAVHRDNAALMRAMGSLTMCGSRSVILVGRKQASTPGVLEQKGDSP
jgi:SAM-dependent methyltransferase